MATPPLRGVLILLVTPPPSLPPAPATDGSLLCTRDGAFPLRGFAGSLEGLDPPFLTGFVTVAARERVLIKLGKKELRGEVGDEGPGNGDPFGDCADD